ncbi:MAG: MBL fold metallo-hydrolase [Firmicutes bacterium]|nr:MBL fold metallo-hydrolase [Bacillota bacterium]
MKITFLGAAHEVTGSCTLIEAGGKNIMVDCGMEQGKEMFERQSSPAYPSEIDCVLLTHAHIDHSGKLPLLYKNGFRGKIFATEATYKLCEIMLKDCAHIQEAEAERKNRKIMRSGGDGEAPMYGMADAEGCLKLFVPCPYGEVIDVGSEGTGIRAQGTGKGKMRHPLPVPCALCPDTFDTNPELRIPNPAPLKIRFTDAGHLLGSSSIEITLAENGETRKIVFSGDLGNPGKPLIKNPQYIRDADYVVIESTYGDRLHAPAVPDIVTEFARFIQKTLDRGGNVVIPSFAVGRTQELLYYLRQIKRDGLVKGHDGFKVFLDSPLAREATEIFSACAPEIFDEATRELLKKGVNPLSFEGLNISITAEDSKTINFDRAPKVIISASGMCEAGRIRHHLKHNLWREESLILFAGYQTQGTLGRVLLDKAKPYVKLFDEEIAVNAEIAYLHSSSAHADKKGLTEWLDAFVQKPKRVFVNHGMPEVCDAFSQYLKTERGYTADAPYSGTVFDLLSDTVITQAEGIRVEKPSGEQKIPPASGGASAKKDPRAIKAWARVTESLRRFSAVVRRCEGLSNRDLSILADQIDKLGEKWRI